MIDVNDLLVRSSSKEHFEDEQYWADLIADMHKYLEEPYPEEERIKIAPLGALERACMILSGIQYKKQNGNNNYKKEPNTGAFFADPSTLPGEYKPAKKVLIDEALKYVKEVKETENRDATFEEMQQFVIR